MVTRVGKELGVEIICAQTDYEGEMCQLVSFRYLLCWHTLAPNRSERDCCRGFPLQGSAPRR
jgi:hypothetical protein